MTLPIFIGYDPRQPVSFTVLVQSIIEHASIPVSIHPLVIETLPLKRTGLTPFTYSRFLVPHLCGYQDHALFLDADELVLGDVADLLKIATDNPGRAVYVRKSPMKFEWASVMLFDCLHIMNRRLTPEYVETAQGLHKIGWCDDRYIGDLPPEWNVLVGYEQGPEKPKLLHYTQGVPAWPETEGGGYRDEWEGCLSRCIDAKPWVSLMGKSVHAKPVIERLQQQQAITPLMQAEWRAFAEKEAAA